MKAPTPESRSNTAGRILLAFCLAVSAAVLHPVLNAIFVGGIHDGWSMAAGPQRAFKAQMRDGRELSVLQEQTHHGGLFEPSIGNTIIAPEFSPDVYRAYPSGRAMWTPRDGTYFLRDLGSRTLSLSYGWPFPSLACDYQASDTATGRSVQTGLGIGMTEPIRTLVGDFPRAIPTRPIPTGLLVNTLVLAPLTYAAIAGFAAVRAWFLRRHARYHDEQLCSWCGYRSDGAECCSECGNAGVRQPLWTRGACIIVASALLASASVVLAMPFTAWFEAAASLDGRWLYLIAPMTIAVLGGALAAPRLRHAPREARRRRSLAFDAVYATTWIAGCWAVLMIGVVGSAVARYYV